MINYFYFPTDRTPDTLRLQTIEPSTTTTRTASVVSSTPLYSPTSPPSTELQDVDLDTILDAAYAELVSANIFPPERTPSASSTPTMSAALTTLPPHRINTFEHMPKVMQEKILSYLTLRGSNNIFSSIVNRNTRTIFSGHSGIISAAYKNQLESSNSPFNPLTVPQYLDYARLNLNPLNIHYHNLRLIDLDDEGLEVLIEQCPNIGTLDLSQCPKITDRGLAHVGNLRHLQELSLCSCLLITHVGLANLANLPLRILDLRYTKTTDAGLAQLAQLDRLERLVLNFTDITDKGLLHLTELSLRELHLFRCLAITNDGLVHLMSLPLRRLELDSPLINDSGLHHLASLPLEYLDLNSCSHTNAGIAYLADLGLHPADRGQTIFRNDTQASQNAILELLASVKLLADMINPDIHQFIASQIDLEAVD